MIAEFETAKRPPLFDPSCGKAHLGHMVLASFASTICMPTIAVLAALEHDLGKPVVSSNAAMMWHELREACEPVAGYGRDDFGRWRDPVYLRTFKLQQSRRTRPRLHSDGWSLVG